MDKHHKVNPRSLQNLRRPWCKGEVPNPTGISVKRRPITDQHWEASGEFIPEKLIKRFNKEVGAELLKPGDTWSRGIAVRAAYISVMEGVVKAMKEIRESCEGRSPQRLEISASPSRVETVIVVKFEDRRGQRHDTMEQMHRANEEAKALPEATDSARSVQ